MLSLLPPAMAESSAAGSSASSEIGNALEANDSERAVWGSSKDFDEATPFGSAWYGYTIAATVVAAFGLINANLPAIEQAAAQAGIDLKF